MILVVGGTGFIGRNLLSALHGRGRTAMSVSRSPDQAFVKRHAPSCSVMDVSAFYERPAILSACSAVVWLAGGAGPSSNADAPWLELRQAIEPMLRMLHAIAAHNPATHFVFLSSGGTVYGHSGEKPVAEDAPLRPVSAYGFSKVMSEKAIDLMASTAGLRATILRPSNPVGAWQSGERQGLVGAILNAAAAGTPFQRIGAGETVRDYFDVRDLCEAILAVLDQPDLSVGQTFNVGSGEGLTINQILAKTAEVTGRWVEVVNVPARTFDVERIVLDTQAIRQALCWQARISLETTIRNMAAARLTET